MRRMLLGVVTAALLVGCQPADSTWQEAGPSVEPEPNPEHGRSTPVADPVYPEYGNPDVDVLHYRLDLRWSPISRVGGRPAGFGRGQRGRPHHVTPQSGGG